MKTAVVIIPTYNEKANIPKVVPRLLEVFDTIKNWKMKVLIVDDSSPDGTADEVKVWQKKSSAVHLFLNKQKSGLGGAYLKGMAEAFNHLEADVVFEFDADLSHDPSKIPTFLKRIDEGYDFVLGSRYIPGGGIPANWGFHRKFFSIVGNIIIMVVFTNFRIRDWTSGYRAITKKVYESVVPELQSEQFSGYTFQIGFLHKTVRNGFKVVEVPFQFVDREIGESKLGMEYVKNNLLFIFKVRAKDILTNRIFKFVMVGGLGAVVQLGTLGLWRMLVPYELAFFLSIECAVFSNFILNNFWTFADRKPKLAEYPSKFIKFNFASAGSIVIQQLIAIVGKNAIGLFPLFTLPLIGLVVDTGQIYAVVGILIGMFWNFFAYNKFVWHAKT